MGRFFENAGDDYIFKTSCFEIYVEQAGKCKMPGQKYTRNARQEIHKKDKTDIHRPDKEGEDLETSEIK